MSNLPFSQDDLKLLDCVILLPLDINFLKIIDEVIKKIIISYSESIFENGTCRLSGFMDQEDRLPESGYLACGQVVIKFKIHSGENIS